MSGNRVLGLADFVAGAIILAIAYLIAVSGIFTTATTAFTDWWASSVNFAASLEVTSVATAEDTAPGPGTTPDRIDVGLGVQPAASEYAAEGDATTPVG